MMRGSVMRTFLLALACVACATALFAAPRSAHAQTLSVGEFSTRLDTAERLVTSASSSLETTAAGATLADSVDALLPRALDVAEGTRTISVDLSEVTAAAGLVRSAGTALARRDAAGQLGVRLTALRTAVGVVGTATADPADPAALHTLVSALPRSTNTAEDWLNTQIQKALNWLAGWLDSLGPRGNAPATGANRAITLLVLVVPVLLAVFVLVRALRARRRRGAAAAVPAASAAPGAPAVAAAANLPQDALGFAQGLAAAGAHRDAVRALYGGAARHLVEAGAVTRMRTRTNLEMLRDVSAADPELAAPFAALTRDFERAWYGHGDPGAPGFEHARASYERIVIGAPAPDGAVQPESGGPR